MGCLNKWIRCVRLECWLWLLLVVVVEKNRGGVLVAMVKGTDYMYYEDFMWNNWCKETHNDSISMLSSHILLLPVRTGWYHATGLGLGCPR